MPFQSTASLPTSQPPLRAARIRGTVIAADVKRREESAGPQRASPPHLAGRAPGERRSSRALERTRAVTARADAMTAASQQPRSQDVPGRPRSDATPVPQPRPPRRPGLLQREGPEASGFARPPRSQTSARPGPQLRPLRQTPTQKSRTTSTPDVSTPACWCDGPLDSGPKDLHRVPTCLPCLLPSRINLYGLVHN